MSTGAGNPPRVGLVTALQFEPVFDTLTAKVDAVVAPEPTEAGVATIVGDVVALISRGPTKITAEHITRAGRLRHIAVTGSGADHVDVAAARAAGVTVTTGAGVATQSVAEYVLGAILVGHRQLLMSNQVLLAERFDWTNRLSICPPGITGTTIGIVGYGHIGRRVSDILIGSFGAHVVAYDPFVDIGRATAPACAEAVDDLDELFARATAVSVHVPLSDTTRGLVSARQVGLLGPDGVLVNTSRGGVVDEESVLAALAGRVLGMAWLDVFDPEPPTRQQLDRFARTPNLVVTPHLAGITMYGRRAAEADAVRRVLAQLAPQGVDRVLQID